MYVYNDDLSVRTRLAYENQSLKDQLQAAAKKSAELEGLLAELCLALETHAHPLERDLVLVASTNAHDWWENRKAAEKAAESRRRAEDEERLRRLGAERSGLLKRLKFLDGALGEREACS